MVFLRMSVSAAKRLFARLGVVMLLFSGAAWAEQGEIPPPRHRLVYENLLVFHYNTSGVVELPSITYRLRLFNKTGPKWEDAHLGIGFRPSVDLVQSRIGPTVTLKPIGFFSITAGYFYNIWYGAFGSLRSYDSLDADYYLPGEFSDSEDAYGAAGHEVQVGARITGAIGPIILSNNAVFYWTDTELKDGDRWYYQPRLDLLVQNRGWYLVNDTDAGIILPFGLNVMARATVLHAFYTGGDSDSRGRNTPAVRLGPLLTYTFFDRAQSHVNKPTLILLTSWWLRNRYRAGESVGQGLPYILFAFKFEGDIWRRD